MADYPVSYKKQDGRLYLSADQKTVSWKPNNASAPSVSIAVADMTNLQQTPEKAAKVSLRIVVQKPGAAQPENHTFTFISATARADQVAIVDILRKRIEAAKAQNVATPVPTPDDSGQSAAMAIAQAVSSGAKPEDNMYDDSRLMANTELQKSLLNSNPALRQRFDQALREKPDTITISQFGQQFWGTRIHLLRSHAVEKSQNQGTYNVLSEVKPKNLDGTKKLNLSKEQIQLIFKQHPLVKRVYNENVPQINEMDFWARFFVSRLFKKLKGEKITDNDSLDPKLDKYLNLEDEVDPSSQFHTSRIPHFIDLSGNEQNNSQQRGNQPDITMQPKSHEKVPILRVLNQISEKMMADVPPADGERHGPAGVDEETFNELQLRDLQNSAEDNRVVLNIRDRDQFFTASQDIKSSTSAAEYAKRTPQQALSAVQNDLRNLTGHKDFANFVGVDDTPSSDEEANPKQKMRVGSKASRKGATVQIMKAIRLKHLQKDDYLTLNAPSSQQAAALGLSQSVFETLAMTHNTTVEFLHYFWSVYFSGDPDRAVEAQKLVETLDKSLDRIKAVASSAEKERLANLEREKRSLDEYQKRTGKRRRPDPSIDRGGAKAVNEVMSSLLRAIRTAVGQYRKAYEAQMSQIAQLHQSLM